MPLDLSPDDLSAYLATADAPAPMLDLVGLMTAHAAAAAVELGVFDVLGDGPRSATEVAQAVSADPVGLPVLLHALVAAGYLDHDGQRYTNRPAAQRWLRSGAPGGFGAVLTLWTAIVTELWAELPATLRGGARPDFYTWLAKDGERLAAFQRLQRGLAGWLADEVVERVAVPGGPARLLDLGGGHAWYTVAFCLRHPAIHATVVDLPAALPTGRDTIAEAGLQGRVTLHAADLAEEVSLPVHDVVLLLNVVHGFPAARARALVHAAVAATRPGGTVAILETTPRPHGNTVDRAFTGLFALNLWHTQGGQVYPPDTLAGWLVEAGCAPPREQPLDRSPTHVLLSAERRAS